MLKSWKSWLKNWPQSQSLMVGSAIQDQDGAFGVRRVKPLLLADIHHGRVPAYNAMQYHAKL